MSLQIVYPMVVDLARPNKNNTLLVMKNDSNSRVCRFILMNDGKAFDTTDVNTVTVKAVKPDQSIVFADAEVSKDEEGNNINEILYALPSDLTNTSGKTVMTLTLLSNTEQLTSFEFYINTRNELYSEDDYASDDDLSGFRDLLNRATAAIAAVEQMTEQSALPNPYPLRIVDSNGTTSYDGSETISYDLRSIQNAITDIKRSFEDGCSAIAQAVTNNGVTTSSTAGVNDIVTNIGKIRSGGTAAAPYILSGFNAYVGKNLISGSMANQGTKTASLNCGQSYTIPQGFHSGSGRVTANSLASQTGVDSGKNAMGAAQLLTGYQGWVNGKKISGTMDNQGTKTASLNCGQSYTIPQGFHSGSGKITANSLASQTQGTANDARILNGYTAWVNGVKVTGSYTPPSASGSADFNLTGSWSGNNESRLQMSSNLRLRVSVNGSTISLSIVSGGFWAQADHWVDDGFVSPVNHTLIPGVAKA